MRKTLYSLQVYRAIAAIFVVLYHLTTYGQETLNYSFLAGAFAFGYTGVDFFFVLSGFIIFYVHYKDIGNRERLGPYFKRRLIRIFPIYWIVLSIKVAVILLMPSIAKGSERELGTIINSYLLIPQNNLPVIGVAWTLSYEIFFYLLFGLSIWFGRKRMVQFAAIWIGLVVLFTAGRALQLPFVGDNYLVFFVTNERNLEFIAGCLSAYLILNNRIRAARPLIITGIVGYCLSALYINAGNTTISHALLFGLPSFLLIVGSATLEMRQKIAWPRLLTQLGDASYSIYLTHALFINVFVLILKKFDLLERYPLPSLLVMAILAVIGGTLVYRLVEKPVLNRLQALILTPRAPVTPMMVKDG